jgi:hypothetical protein
VWIRGWIWCRRETIEYSFYSHRLVRSRPSRAEHSVVRWTWMIDSRARDLFKVSSAIHRLGTLCLSTGDFILQTVISTARGVYTGSQPESSTTSAKPSLESPFRPQQDSDDTTTKRNTTSMRNKDPVIQKILCQLDG